MADHPQVITGTLAGITSSMAAFKAVKAASALPKLLMSVSGAGRMAGGSRRTAVGGIVGIAAAVKTADQRLKKQNLADHFRGHQPVHKGPPADIPGDGKNGSP